MKKLFPYTVLLAALSLASCAAYYSVFGLSKLFSSQAVAVIIMASVLEVSKLLTATYLHRYGKKISFLLKTYLTTAVIVLMMITSLGIYGFLTSAYQETALKQNNIDSQIILLESRKSNLKSQLEVYTEEQRSINEAVSELRKGLSNNKVQWRDRETGQIITSTSSSTRRALEKQLDQAIVRQTEINSKVDKLNSDIIDLESNILETQLGDETTKELGPLKYLSELLNVPMNSIVNWFVLAFIFVFDPLAVLLLIAANRAFSLVSSKKRENIYGETVEVPKKETIENDFVLIEECKECNENPCICHPIIYDEDFYEKDKPKSTRKTRQVKKVNKSKKRVINKTDKKSNNNKPSPPTRIIN